MLTFKQFIGEDIENIDEKINNNIQHMGRINLYKIRIRAGKVQRRVKRSAIKGYTIKGGRLVKMSSSERMKRKKGARRAKIKRRAHKSQIAKHRKISIRKRHSLGLQ